MDEFKEYMAEKAYGKTREAAWNEGKCINCGRKALEHCTTDAGRKEYFISGLCEECFDSLFED